ncbi:MAG: rhomboid family intramembrane serine protease [Crocinitomicaceae bacterium]
MIGGNVGNGIANLTISIFYRLPFKAFIFKAPGLFTSIFTHFTGLMHLLFNMLFLYSVGRMFEQFFSAKRFILYTYILGGLAGGILN